MVYPLGRSNCRKDCQLYRQGYASGEFVDPYWDNMVKDNIKELDVYVEELEGNSIYEIDSVQDYHKLEEIL